MKRLFMVCAVILCTTAIGSAQNVFYFPHIVDGNAGGVWKTTIYLTNPAASGTVSGSIKFTRDNATLTAAGAPMALAFVNELNQPVQVAGDTLAFQIAGGESRKYTSTGAGVAGQFVGGFATVSSAGAISGTAIFSYAGAFAAEAGVPAGNATARQSIFVDVGGGFDVGVAMANAGATAANMTLRVLNTNAQTVVTTTYPAIGAGNHIAGFVSQLFPGQTLPTPLNGTMQITSTNGSFAAIALRFAPSGVFTTLPPVTIASLLAPARDWLEQRPWAIPMMSIARLVAAFQYRLG